MSGLIIIKEEAAKYKAVKDKQCQQEMLHNKSGNFHVLSELTPDRLKGCRRQSSALVSLREEIYTTDSQKYSHLLVFFFHILSECNHRLQCT